jgi:hypothetical protein
MMMFCALLLVKNSKATVEQSMNLVPLAGKAKFLAGEMTNAGRLWTPAPGFSS